MTFAIITFALSLLAIIALFLFKAWESRTSKVLASGVRERADRHALELKKWFLWSREEFKKLPPEIVFLVRTVLHDAALGAAHIARSLERQSHRLAELVSHKHGFERRETQSDFLKNVSGYKNGQDESLDTTDQDVQNG